MVSSVSVEPEPNDAIEQDGMEEVNDEASSTQNTTDTDTTDTSDVFNGIAIVMITINDKSIEFSGNTGVVDRIEPYVDFSQFYRNVEIARQNGTLPESLR